MKSMPVESLAYLLLPQEALLPLLTLAGLLMILGFRRASIGLIGFVITAAFLPLFEPVIGALFDLLPGWAVLLLVVFVALQVLRFLGELLFGPEAWGSFFGGLLLALFLLPFRGLGRLLRWLATN
jgi:hypothetical protein